MKNLLIKLLLFLTVLIIGGNFIFGQSPRVERIRQTNPITKEVYLFPKIIISNSSSVAQKINNRIQEQVLGISYPTKDAHIFDSIWRTSYRMEQISNLSFRVSEVSSSLISFTISGEGCGAYCEPFNYYFTFNTKTGNQLTLDSLFTSKGITTFVKALNDTKIEKLNKKLKQLTQLLTNNIKIDSTEKERISEMQFMYTDCLSKKITSISEIQFLIKAGTITVFTDRCSAHYNMTYDDLWTFVYRASLKNSKKLLNSYGLGLINS